MPRKWTPEQSIDYWASRPWHIVGGDDRRAQRIIEYTQATESRQNDEDRNAMQFAQENANKQQRPEAENFIGGDEADNLLFWVTHCSWSKCSRCQSLQPCKLFPRFKNRPLIKDVKDCGCTTQRYLVPQFDDIPVVLRNLNRREILALRPLDVHLGDYTVHRFGYRQKSTMFKLSWSDIAVEDKIANLPEESKRKCQLAYHYLMQNDNSHYKSFIEKRETAMSQDKRFNLYDSASSRYVENCLWPDLYPFRSWCDSAMEGQQSRLSSKISFMKKITSTIADYSMNYELLQFHYDLWLFRTVSGAVSVGRAQYCSPAKSLDTKSFSTEYWRWQLRFLLDAVRQFGSPSVFITISPYEWSFPFPPWLENLRKSSGYGPTQLAPLETLHIVQVLEQICRGYLGGTNTNTWTNHIFNYNRLPRYPNVQTLFYRFEFQQRGTVHLHMLVFLKDMKYCRLKTIRADIPWSHLPLAYLVQKLQPSDKGCLPLREQGSQLVVADNQPSLQLFHPEEAFAQHLRAYISTLLPALKCRMDIQTSDGNSMLLRYVTSYVTKCHDNEMSDALYSQHVTPFQAAYRHLRMITPLEPEMLMTLTSKRVAYTNSRTKKITCPSPETISTMKEHQLYIARKPEEEASSFLDWLRQHDTSSPNCKKYKAGETLVGLKMKSPFTDIYFFQDILLHYPHRQVSQLYHPDCDNIPYQIRHFASAWLLRPQLWQDLHEVENLFKLEGHKTHYIQNVVAHVKSQTVFFRLWQRRVFGINVVLPVSCSLDDSSFDVKQLQVLRHVERSLTNRYDDMSQNQQIETYDHESDSDIEEEDIGSQQTSEQETATHYSIDWRKFVLVVGKPGTGKTHVVSVAVERAIQNEFRVAIAAPTGFLASMYRSVFEEDVYIDTVHAMFHYPVETSERPSVNWLLGEYDLLLIDEISMIPETIFNHILRTLQDLPMRPVLVLSGDPQQQQPIAQEGGQTVKARSILENKKFYSLVTKYVLQTQYRCEDEKYYNMLNHLRYYMPNINFIRELEQGRVLVTENPVTDDHLYNVLCQYPDATFLTISRNASCRINTVALNRLFTDPPAAIIQYDCTMPPMPIYCGLPVIVTQNRDKRNGVVNGRKAKVTHVQGATVFLKLPNGFITATYPVTVYRQQQRWTSYPFAPAYSITVTKSQGQTLERVIVWFDSTILPPGGAYVALSRIKKLVNLNFLVETKRAQYKPVYLIAS